MSRIAFRICGFIDSGDPSLSPLNGWYWPSAPFPQPPANPLPNSEFPVVVSPQDLIALYWRINELTVTFDIDSTSGQNVSETDVLDLSSIGVTNEQQLITADAVLFQNEIAGSQLTFELSPDQIQPDAWPPVNLYPVFFLSVLIDSGFELTLYDQGNGPTSITISSSTIPSLDGLSLYAPDPASGFTYSGTMSIEATGYWPYASTASPAPPDPGPIYDSATGAVLITPIPTAF